MTLGHWTKHFTMCFVILVHVVFLSHQTPSETQIFAKYLPNTLESHSPPLIAYPDILSVTMYTWACNLGYLNVHVAARYAHAT